jgi:hypothetical protein
LRAGSLQIEFLPLRAGDFPDDPKTHASRGRQWWVFWQAEQCSGMAQSGNESNCTVSVLRPVEMMAACTGQRIMMAGMVPA